MMVPRLPDGLCLLCYGKRAYDKYLDELRGTVTVICACQEERVRFIQYLRPDGRQREMFLEAQSPEIVAKAAEIWKAGYRLESEILMSDMVSLTISDGEEDVAIELAPNGPEVAEAAARMISGFILK